MQNSISNMVQRIVNILSPCAPSIYLYGSVVLDDFKLGWSGIDILVLTQVPISEEQAYQLVNLRQTMLADKPGNPYYRAFEGGMLTVNAFLTYEPDRVVLLGDQRRTHYYQVCLMWTSFGGYCYEDPVRMGT